MQIIPHTWERKSSVKIPNPAPPNATYQVLMLMFAASRETLALDTDTRWAIPLLVVNTPNDLLQNAHIAQVLVLGVVLVQIYVAVPPAARAQPSGRSLLRPSPSRPSQHGLEEGEEPGRKKEDERKHRIRRRLEPQADATVKLVDSTRMAECAAVKHESNSMTDDSLPSTVTVGTAEVWAKLQLAESGEHCRSEGECCLVSTFILRVCSLILAQ